MPTKFTGGCLCGRVRYECSADPFFMGNCHCRDCQKATGGAYEPDIGLPAAALKVTGAVKYYDKKADSGNTLSRGFCPECGSSLFGRTSAMPDLAMITAGSLDDPSLGHLHIQRPALGSYEFGTGQVSQDAADGKLGGWLPTVISSVGGDHQLIKEFISI